MSKQKNREANKRTREATKEVRNGPAVVRLEARDDGGEWHVLARHGVEVETVRKVLHADQRVYEDEEDHEHHKVRSGTHRLKRGPSCTRGEAAGRSVAGRTSGGRSRSSARSAQTRRSERTRSKARVRTKRRTFAIVVSSTWRSCQLRASLKRRKTRTARSADVAPAPPLPATLKPRTPASMRNAGGAAASSTIDTTTMKASKTFIASCRYARQPRPAIFKTSSTTKTAVRT